MYKVLLVDDESLVVEGLGCILDWNAMGFEIAATAANGEEALNEYKQNQFDLIITDIRMPGMDGIQLVKEIRNRNPYVKIIVLSGYDEFEYAKKLMSFGIMSYLLKPVDRMELKELLDTIKKEFEKDLLTIQWNNEQFIQIIKEKSFERLNEKFSELTGILAEMDDHFEQKKMLLYSIFQGLNRIKKDLFEIKSTDVEKIVVESTPEQIVALVEAKCKETIADSINKKNGNLNDVAVRAREFMLEHYHEELTLKNMATLLFVHPTYLGFVYKNEFHISFVDDLNKLRIENIKKLVLETNRPIGTIITEVGYNNTQYFYKQFKKYEGITFQDYRNELKKYRIN